MSPSCRRVILYYCSDIHSVWRPRSENVHPQFSPESDCRMGVSSVEDDTMSVFEDTAEFVDLTKHP